MTPRFRVAGIPVRVHLLFLLVAVASGWSRLRMPEALLSWVAVVFVSVLAHELGHALAYRRLGWRPSIELYLMGGLTTASGGGRLRPAQEAWVSFAGPLTGFAIGGLVFALQKLTPLREAGGLARIVVSDVLWVNVGWGLVNLLPMSPLDGGHIMEAGVRAWKGERGERLVHLISLVTACLTLVAALVWLKFLWLGMLAVFIGVSHGEQLLRLRARKRYLVPLEEQARRNLGFARPAPPSVDSLLSELKLPSRRAGTASASAAEEPDVPHDPRLVGELLLQNGLASLALRPLREAFKARPSPETAHPLVLALLEAGHHAELATLLEAPDALQVGAPTLELLATRATEAGQPALAARAQLVLSSRRAPATPREDERR
jgi:Zn-dependent protease